MYPNPYASRYMYHPQARVGQPMMAPQMGFSQPSYQALGQQVIAQSQAQQAIIARQLGIPTYTQADYQRLGEQALQQAKARDEAVNRHLASMSPAQRKLEMENMERRTRALEESSRRLQEQNEKIVRDNAAQAKKMDDQWRQQHERAMAEQRKAHEELMERDRKHFAQLAANDRAFKAAMAGNSGGGGGGSGYGSGMAAGFLWDPPVYSTRSSVADGFRW